MAIDLIPLNEYKTKKFSTFEVVILEPTMKEMPELWNSNPKILDDGVVLFICQSGKGKLVIDMNTFTIQKGSFCLLLPYMVIQVLEYSDDFKATAITAGIELLEKLAMLQPVEDYANLIQENPCLNLNEKQLKDVKEIYDFINNRLSNNTRPLINEIRDTLITLIALEVVSAYANHKPTEKRRLSRHEQIFRTFTISLAKNFRAHRNVEFYAEEACLTPRHFAQVVKNKSGKLPTQWIAERTIILIKFLLENTAMPIQEIANELNFPNQSFFSKYFRKHTGLTPKDYRTKKSV